MDGIDGEISVYELLFPLFNLAEFFFVRSEMPFQHTAHVQRCEFVGVA